MRKYFEKKKKHIKGKQQNYVAEEYTIKNMNYNQTNNFSSAFANSLEENSLKLCHMGYIIFCLFK